MYKIVKLDHKQGKWVEVSELNSLKEFSTDESNVYVFYVGELPIDKNEQNEIIENVIKANKNKINRVTIGAKLTSMDSDTSPSSCPGSCWCIVDGGSRYCETCYCNGNGYCWCVRCSGSC